MKLVKILLLFIALATIGCAQKENPSYAKDDLVLIPQPKSLKLNKGSFEVTKSTKIVIPQDSLASVSSILNDLFKKAAGFELETSAEATSENSIQLKINSEIAKEAYQLKVTSENVILEANSKLGFVYGLETIRQLLPKEIESGSKVSNIDWYIPNVEISDAPQYSYRGNMLDVSRHFFGKDYIKKHIDRLAFLKLNTFHFHLVDDQGWRIEIKKYPKLTEVGGFRVDQEDSHWNARTKNDPDAEATFGGFYTQEDIKEIVAYAQEKGIRVIPEIEAYCGSFRRSLANYRYLLCRERIDFRVFRRSAYRGDGIVSGRIYSCWW